MVSSTVTGQEDRLLQVFDVLRALGYEVWMSARGTLPLDSKKHNLGNCLTAVDDADFVLIIIDRRYGSVSPNSAEGLSVFHEEVRRAVDTNKQRFVFVHRDVALAHRILGQFGDRSGKTPWQIAGFKPIPDVLEDLRVLDIYDYALQEHLQEADRRNWVQSFPDIANLLEAVRAQFADPARTKMMVTPDQTKSL